MTRLARRSAFRAPLAAALALLFAAAAGAAQLADGPGYRVGIALQAGVTPDRGFAAAPGDYGSRVETGGVQVTIESARGWRLHLEWEQMAFWAPRTICTLECGPGAVGYSGRAHLAGLDWLVRGPTARVAPYLGARAGTFRRYRHSSGSYGDPVVVGDVHAGLELRLVRWLAPYAELRSHSHSPLVVALGLRGSAAIRR